MGYIEQWRSDTPGSLHCTHLNNAGASLMPTKVIDAIKLHIDLEAKMGGYEAAAHQADAIGQFYDQAANLFRAQSKNFAFTANATDAYNRALSSIEFKPGDVILTTSNDYVSNFVVFLNLKKRWGIQIKIVSNLPSGEIDLDALRDDIIKFQPTVFSLTHIPTNSGLIQPADAAGQICKENEIIYLVDGCQSAGQLDVNLTAMQCDFYSATFRKFLRGPRGAGFLYVSDRMLDNNYHPLFLDMRGADWIEEENFSLKDNATRFEDWENSYASLLGASAALAYANSVGMPVIQNRVQLLANQLREKLSNIERVSVMDRGTQKGAIVTAHIESLDPQLLKSALRQEKINCSFGTKLNALLDFKEKKIDWIVRFAPHYFNTEEEIKKPVAVIQDILH
ncbi:MAG: aminotransferase class V-fold PLP-dependent enzyme [Saprospiraceae bacterium]|nr:aminotransferase class V-fold PLP-dependent enzyme [Saprospiraceae bacterium]